MDNQPSEIPSAKPDPTECMDKVFRQNIRWAVLLYRPEALLFDCDGVLVDTEPDGHRVAFNEAFKQKGRALHWVKLQCLLEVATSSALTIADLVFGRDCA